SCVRRFTSWSGASLGIPGLNACLDGCGGAQCLHVAAASDCRWTATVIPNPACGSGDAVITGGHQTCGDGTVCFTYGRNGCRRARSLAIQVGAKLFLTLPVYTTPP